MKTTSKTDLRVHFSLLADGRRVRVAPETEKGHGGGSQTTVVARVVGQLPWDIMLNRGQLTHDQHAQADHMHALFVVGGLVPVRAQAMERVDNSPAVDAERVMAAKKEYFGLLNRLEPRGASVVHSVCGECRTIAEWSKSHGVNPSYGSERLREALNVLLGLTD